MAPNQQDHSRRDRSEGGQGGPQDGGRGPRQGGNRRPQAGGSRPPQTGNSSGGPGARQPPGQATVGPRGPGGGGPRVQPGPSTERRVGAGFVGGLVAFVAGYAVLFLVKGSSIMTNFFAGMSAGGTSAQQFQQMGGSLPEQWKVVGMVYHSVHLQVPYDVSVTTGSGQSMSREFSRPFLSGELFPWLVPILVLFLAGVALATIVEGEGAQPGALTGASLAVGYLVAAVVTTFVFAWTTTLSGQQTVTMTIKPSLAMTLVFTGLLYPVLFGGLGGLLGGVTKRNQNRTTPSGPARR